MERFKKRLVIFLGLTFFMGVLLGACDSKMEEGEPMTWDSLPGFPGVARASACGFATSDKLFVGLGRSGERTGLLKDFWCYNTLDSTWTRMADFPGEPRVKAVAVFMNGKGYVGMGSKGVSQNFRDFWSYDIEQNTWSKMDSFPSSASNGLSASVVDNELITCWGFDGVLVTDVLYKYNPVQNKWSAMEPKAPPKDRLSAAAFSIDGYFFVGGGYKNMHYVDFYRLDVANGSWKRCQNLPNKRMLSNAVSMGGKGYYMLGRYWSGTLNGGKLLSDVLEYDPTRDVWTDRGHFPGGARQNSVVLTCNGVGYVICGETDTKRLSDLWKFEP